MFVLDLWKALDSINHDIHLEKLKLYGIRRRLYEFPKLYLSHKTQYTEVHSMKSDAKTIKTGVPHGSVWGPLLFNIFINDLMDIGELTMFYLLMILFYVCPMTLLGNVSRILKL